MVLQPTRVAVSGRARGVVGAGQREAPAIMAGVARGDDPRRNLSDYRSSDRAELEHPTTGRPGSRLAGAPYLSHQQIRSRSAEAPAFSRDCGPDREIRAAGLEGIDDAGHALGDSLRRELPGNLLRGRVAGARC